MTVARKIRVVSAFRTTIGLPRRLSVRLQPNHPADDPTGVAAAVLDGLLMGAGDAVIGINPAGDDIGTVATLLTMLDEIRQGLGIPTQSCVLTHITNTIELVRRGAPVDLCFQSIAGTEGANRGFGIDLALLREGADATLALDRGTVGTDVMYFETGQGSCAVGQRPSRRRPADPGMRAPTRWPAQFRSAAGQFSVVGFIGPEYLYDGKEIIRAGLEDHLLRQAAGAAARASTFVTPTTPKPIRTIWTRSLDLARRLPGVNFIMGVPGADDIMLGYQSTSFHDALYIREALGLRPAPEFEAWLGGTGLVDARGRPTDRPRLPGPRSGVLAPFHD